MTKGASMLPQADWTINEFSFNIKYSFGASFPKSRIHFNAKFREAYVSDAIEKMVVILFF